MTAMSRDRDEDDERGACVVRFTWNQWKAASQCYLIPYMILLDAPICNFDRATEIGKCTSPGTPSESTYFIRAS
jgi:hypothetical protein